MGLKKVLFDKQKRIIISGNWDSDFNEDPCEVMAGIKKPDEISEKLNELLIGVDISSLQKSRVEAENGKIYYNTGEWRLVELVQGQKQNDPLLQKKEYVERLRYGTGPFNIYIPEEICTVTNLS